MPANTTEVIARGLLIYDGKVLVCRNVKNGHRFLPGGHVEFDEPAGESLAREMREEAGVELTAGGFLGVIEAAFDQKRRHHEINLIFQLSWADRAESAPPPEIVSQEPHIDFEWIPLGDARTESPDIPILPGGLDPFLADAPVPSTLSSVWQ